MLSQMTVAELRAAMLKGALPPVIDVRDRSEFSASHISGARHIPLGELSQSIMEAHPDKNAAVVVYCDTGVRSHHAARLLRSLGYKNVLEVAGGFYAYQRDSGTTPNFRGVS